MWLGPLRDPQTFSSRISYDDMISPVPLVPLGFDPPEHTRYRRILHPFFSPQTLAFLLPSLQAQVIDIIDAIAERGGCEVMADLVTPYPSQVFLTLFGLPLEDRQRLIAWKDAIIAVSLTTDPAGEDLTPAAELYTYLTEAVQEQRQHRGEGILSELLHGDEPLTDAEAVGLSLVFVLAGLDTVTSAIGVTMLELARRPDLRASLRENPDDVGVWVRSTATAATRSPATIWCSTASCTSTGASVAAHTAAWAPTWPAWS